MSQREFQSENEAATFVIQKRDDIQPTGTILPPSFLLILLSCVRLFSVETHTHTSVCALWIKKKGLLLNVTWRQMHRAPPTEWHLFLSDEKKSFSCFGRLARRQPNNWNTQKKGARESRHSEIPVTSFVLKWCGGGKKLNHNLIRRNAGCCSLFGN